MNQLSFYYVVIKVCLNSQAPLFEKYDWLNVSTLGPRKVDFRCISRPTFKLFLLDIMGKSKEINQDLRFFFFLTSTSLVHPWEQFPNA